MKFLELIENMKQEKANVRDAFKEDGESVRSKEENLAKIAEGAEFLEEIKTGKKPLYLFREAMSTSDFPLIFGQIIDRQLLGNYKAFSANYSQYTKVERVRDFRTVDRYYIDGAEGVMSTVAELEEYPHRAVTEGRYQFSVQKYGAVMPVSWEARINDDLGALEDWPARLAKAANRTVEKLVTEQYVDASGPHASLYGVDNTISGNPVLSLDALRQGVTLASQQVDTDGEPIWIEELYLVVPPALTITANDIMNTMEYRILGPNDEVSVVRGNGIGNITIITNPYIPIVASSNGDTSWFLFASPNDSRPALVTGFLRGHEAPELFMRAPNAMRIGGGQVNPLDGDFATDSIDYKIRFVAGAARMDPKTTIASSGAGS